MVLVILIALWAMVLLPPYLKDRRASGRAFRSSSVGRSGGGVGSVGLESLGSSVNPAQRFLPLQNASAHYSSSAVAGPTGMRTTGRATPARRAGSSRSVASGRALDNLPSTGAASSALPASNVVPLRPVEAGPSPTSATNPAIADSPLDPLAERQELALSALDHQAGPAESILHDAWDRPKPSAVGIPRSTAAARERRRHVLLAMTAMAVITLLLALAAGGRWVAAHVLVDVVMIGYVILLVRHRQLDADRRRKVEPIRPPVNEQTPASLQLAPAYLNSKTGS